MQFSSRYLRRFSLRGMFIAMTLASIYLGMHFQVVRQNKAAIRELRDRGFLLGCTHMDPFGPNCFYTWDFDSIPNDYFSKWFETWFCIEQQDQMFCSKLSVTQSDILLLSKIPLKNGSCFRDSRFEMGAIQTMVDTCKFEGVAFEDAPLSIDEFSSLSKMTCLSRIFLLGSSQSKEGLQIIRESLPDCEVLLE